MAGTGVVALDVAGPIEPWRALGFAVGDDGSCRVGNTLLRLGRDGAPGLVGWVLSGAPPLSTLDGVPTEHGEPLADDGGAPEHPNTAVSVDHVVVMTTDVDRTFAALAAAGMTLRRERQAGTPDRPLRYGFFRHSECIVEVVGPVDAEPDAGPARLWGVTVTVTDIDAAAGLMGPLLGRVKDAVQPGRRIATVRTESGTGVPLALIS